MSSPSNDERGGGPQPLPAGEAVPAPASPEPAAGAGAQSGPAPGPPDAAALRPLVIEALSKVFDPEIPVNIYDLGLIYDVAIDASASVAITMTLTAPGCPAAFILPLEVERRVRGVPGVAGVAGRGGLGPAVGPGQDVRGGQTRTRAVLIGLAAGVTRAGQPARPVARPPGAGRFPDRTWPVPDPVAPRTPAR